jgi:hypothetical protein
MNLAERQKAVFLGAVVNKRGLKIRLNCYNSPFVNIVLGLGAIDGGDMDRLQATILKKGKPALFRLLGVNKKFQDKFVLTLESLILALFIQGV